MGYIQPPGLYSMYTAFYGLREKPFSLSPNPRFLFLSESHREALAHLLYGIDEGEGFIAITGEVGTGKTTICRTLLERLASDTEVAFLFNPSGSPDELLRAIAREFGLDVDDLPSAELGDRLNRFLLEKKREKRRVLLIIDEAQNLSVKTLEQIRLLSNLETSSSKLIQILLLGQPELDRKLESTELRQLRQRIGVRWSLDALSLREASEYIRYRLRIAAGAPRDLFTPAALRELHKRSGGVPRLINILCDRSLLAGYATGEARVSRKTVRACAREIPAASGRSVRAGSSARSGWSLAAVGVAVGSIAGAGVLALALFALGSSGFSNFAQLAGTSEAPSSALADVSAAPPIAGSGAPPAEIDRSAAELPRIHVQIHAEEATAASDAATAELGAALAAIDPIGAPANREKTGGILGRLLQGQDRGAARFEAVNSILAAYALPPLEKIPRSETEALMWLEERGLAVLPVQNAKVDLLRALNHPALLRLQSDRGETRLVALNRLEGQLGSLHGATGRGQLEVSLEELESRWQGRAYVVWRGFEELPDRFAFGESGPGVTWLQGALSQLGLLEGIPSGVFDAATLEGVRGLQLSRSLEPDGVVGPKTQMILYDLLGRYAVPHLASDGGQSG